MLWEISPKRRETGSPAEYISPAEIVACCALCYHSRMSFWQTLPQPIIGLSPMDGVTDAAFRFIVARHGKPDVQCTEFIHVEEIRRGTASAWRQLRFCHIKHILAADVKH